MCSSEAFCVEQKKETWYEGHYIARTFPRRRDGSLSYTVVPFYNSKTNFIIHFTSKKNEIYHCEVNKHEIGNKRIKMLDMKLQ